MYTPLVNLPLHCLMHGKMLIQSKQGKNMGSLAAGLAFLSQQPGLFPNLPILFPSFPGRDPAGRSCVRRAGIETLLRHSILRSVCDWLAANYFHFLQSTSIRVERAGDRVLVRLETKVICAKKGFMPTISCEAVKV